MLQQSMHYIHFKTLFVRNSQSCIASFLTNRHAHQLSQTNNPSAEYPSIFDTSEEGFKKYNRQLWYESIKKMNTVEEKLHELARGQRYKVPKYILKPVPSTYTSIFFNRYITRTTLVKGLPEKLTQINVDDEFLEVENSLNETLFTYYCNPWMQNQTLPFMQRLCEPYAGSELVKSLVSHCYKKLSLRNDHIINSTIHSKPRINSFWWHQGFESEENEVHEKNLCFFFEDRPAFILRSKQNLSPIFNWDSELCATADVKNYHYHPDVFDIPHDGRWLSSTPGFWPGDPHEFPTLIVKTADELLPLIKQVEKCSISEIENSVGALSCFGVLNATATYQGFTPFHDITYPLVTQMILTNGQDWTFFVYQMNTCAFHEDVDLKNRRNICWTSGKMRLFDTVEDGKIKGINQEVFRTLLRLLLHSPESHLEDNSVLKPYLGEDTRTQEDIENTRMFLRQMMSQRPDPNDHKEEIPTWQQIYKFHKDAPPCPTIKME